jgi:hypothetical protein
MPRSSASPCRRRSAARPSPHLSWKSRRSWRARCAAWTMTPIPDESTSARRASTSNVLGSYSSRSTSNCRASRALRKSSAPCIVTDAVCPCHPTAASKWAARERIGREAVIFGSLSIRPLPRADSAKPLELTAHDGCHAQVVTAAPTPAIRPSGRWTTWTVLRRTTGGLMTITLIIVASIVAVRVGWRLYRRWQRNNERTEHGWR